MKTKLENILKPKSEEEIFSSIKKKRYNSSELLVKSIKIGFTPGVKKALKMGATIHKSNHALGLAIKYNNLKIAKLLIDVGAKINIQNRLLELASESSFKMFKLIFNKSLFNYKRFMQIKCDLKSTVHWMKGLKYYIHYNAPEMNKIINFLEKELTEYDKSGMNKSKRQ